MGDDHGGPFVKIYFFDEEILTLFHSNSQLSSDFLGTLNKCCSTTRIGAICFKGYFWTTGSKLAHWY